MRVRELLRGRMVATEFADWGLLDAETRSAKRRLPSHPVSGVECVGSGAGCNTVPIEKGTETYRRYRHGRCVADDATPSPSRRGLKPDDRLRRFPRFTADATPSPSRRGLKRSIANHPITLMLEMQHRPHREGD